MNPQIFDDFIRGCVVEFDFNMPSIRINNSKHIQGFKNRIKGSVVSNNGYLIRIISDGPSLIIKRDEFDNLVNRYNIQLTDEHDDNSRIVGDLLDMFSKD